jgi:hypothetical protein
MNHFSDEWSCSARNLERLTDRARATAGVPEWESVERPGTLERLAFLEDPEFGAVWAIIASDSDTGDYIPVDVSLAKRLLAEHFRQWLAGRGWQVQVTVRRTGASWRLADCLAAAAGGGDRLDEDYPTGDDEFGVLCRAVETVDRASVPNAAAGFPRPFPL